MKSPKIIDRIEQEYINDVIAHGGGWTVPWTVISEDVLFQLSRMNIPYYHVDTEMSIPYLTDGQKQILEGYIDLPWEPVQQWFS